MFMDKLSQKKIAQMKTMPFCTDKIADNCHFHCEKNDVFEFQLKIVFI